MGRGVVWPASGGKGRGAGDNAADRAARDSNPCTTGAPHTRGTANASGSNTIPDRACRPHATRPSGKPSRTVTSHHYEDDRTRHDSRLNRIRTDEERHHRNTNPAVGHTLYRHC